MVSTEPLRAETIYRAAQARIKQYIVQHRLAPGDAIPTETTLARELGISRNTLREALKALATAGIVETRHGLGTYVGQASLGPLIDGMAFNLLQNIGRDTRTLREMLQLREILEVALVRQMSGLHTPEQLLRLGECVVRMEADAAQEIMDPHVDRAFHDMLYEPLDNHAVTLILHAFWDVQEAVTLQLTDVPSIVVANARWHRTIFDAVRRDDADAAAIAMREHFTGIQTRLNCSLEEPHPHCPEGTRSPLRWSGERPPRKRDV
ncbi:MAG: GntR family transcriptional regulator [Chloroflexota bacterium]|nr:GntR family transcriptional regulator [Chloroflexota bacterium]